MTKRTPRRLMLTALLALLPSAAAADLTLTYGFSEVREPVKLAGTSFTWAPPSDVSGFVVPGSLSLEYPGVTRLTTYSPNPNLLAAFVGKEVLVRRDGQQVRARVVNAELNLFTAGGQFFQADPATVTYPSLEGVRFTPQYTWAFTGAGGGATLTYLTRGLSWAPRYTLTVKNTVNGAADARLEAWADVRNAGGLAYSAPNLSLLAGEVQLASPSYGPPSPAAATFESRAASLAGDSVEASGEASGLQTFAYPSAVTLPARSTTSLRFIQTNVTLERTLEYASGFSQAPRQVVPLQRVYTVKAGANLPSGVVTVREENRVVGQARVSDTPKAEPATLRLGSDFDLRLTRTVETLERSQTSARYRVAFSLTNTKARPVAVRLRENFGGDYTLEAVSLPNAKREADGLTAAATLAPGAKLEGGYTVTFKYGN